MLYLIISTRKKQVFFVFFLIFIDIFCKINYNEIVQNIFSFKIAKLVIFPFGKVVKSDFGKHPIANIIWILFGGLELAVGYLFVGLLLCITIIGIPFGKQCFKLAQLALVPFGATV